MATWTATLLDPSVAQPALAVSLALIGVGLVRGVVPHARARLRVPALLIGAFIALTVAREVLPLRAPTQTLLSALAQAAILVALTQLVLLIVVEWLVHWWLGRPLSRIVRDILQGVAYFAVGIATLRALGAEIGSLLTTSALLTAVIGLSLQETLGNLFAGLAMQGQRTFSVGDWIQFDDNVANVGVVVEVGWRATRLVTSDNVEVVVPNGVLAKSPIRNHSQPTGATRRMVYVAAPYDVPPERVQRALLGMLRHTAGVVAEPAPVVWVWEYQDSGVQYALVFFITEYARRLGIDAEVRRRAWYALQRIDVNIPFPVRDVRIRHINEATIRAEEEVLASTRQRLLHGVDFLDALPESSIAELAERTITRLFAPGELIIHQGEEGTDLFIVERGSVAVLIRGERADEEVARLGPGQFFGEMSLVTGERRTATVRAVDEASLIVVTAEAFRDLLAHSPEAVAAITEVLGHRQAVIDERVRIRMASTMPASEGRSQVLERFKKLFALG